MPLRLDQQAPSYRSRLGPLDQRRPPGNQEALTTFRAASAAVAAAVQADREQNLTRLRLMTAIPVLMARQAAEGHKTVDLIAQALATRTGRSTQDYQLRLAAAALAAAQFEAARYWADHDGTDDPANLMDQAVTAVGPLLAALDPSAQ